MLQSTVPVLLLAAIALSSSNIFPIVSSNQIESEFAIDGQQNDNIFSNRFIPRDIFEKVFYTLPVETQRNKLFSQIEKFDKNDHLAEAENDVERDEDNYDGKGFRKEQWHNYPRQLDRLQKYLFASHTVNKKVPETNDLDNPEGLNPEDSTNNDDIGDVSTNEYYIQNDGINNVYDTVVAATNPLLILKIHLAGLNNRIKDSLTKHDEISQSDPEIEDAKLFPNEIKPVTKVKRDDYSSEVENLENDLTSKKSKRLFSLWSRLQTLSHQGHDLPHRRHLAFYGFPDEESGGSSGTLSSPQTRATFVRPPGSPLRWG